MKKILLSLTFFACLFSLTAFDWPQNEIASDSFSVYYGQLRGGLLSPSLVFSGSEEIKSAAAGFVTAVLTEHDEQPMLFESTLGNAAIICHDDNLMTVYANLSAETNELRSSLTEIPNEQPLGTCGNSGWQEGSALLEFQVVDIEAKTFVNPRMLMPRFGNEPVLSIKNVTAVNKKGVSFDLNTHKTLASGSYYLYRERQKDAMPYKTTVLINGASVDTITYDTLVQVKGKLCTSGRKNYPCSLIYPDSKQHLLAEITIPKGKTKITIVTADILGKEKSLTYTIDAY